MTTLEHEFDTEWLIDRVRAAQRGDREALDELFRHFERAVFATAFRRLGNYAEAEELTQEVFVQALRKIDQLREPAAFGGWLRQITVRMAINRAVRAAPEIDAENEILDLTCVERETPLTHALASERRREVRAGLRRLRKLDRATLKAFYVDGQSLLEMADSFNSPLGTIKRRLHVARKRLAKELKEMASA